MGKIPSDLDSMARKKFKEIAELVGPDVDSELIANYARMYSSLMAIRTEKNRQIKARTYQTLVPGRDGTQQLNPLQTAENRMVANLNRQLRTLGLAPSSEEQDRRKAKGMQHRPPPPGFSGPEPKHGWVLEIALNMPLPGMASHELQAAWQQWLETYYPGQIIGIQEKTQ